LENTSNVDRVYKCLKDCLRRCTGLGASRGAVQGASRLGSSRECSKGSAGGLVREGELARGAALSAYRSQHKPGGRVVRTEAPTDGVVHTLPVDEASDEADVIRRTK